MRTVFTIKSLFVDARNKEWAEILEDELAELLRKYRLLLPCRVVIENEITGNTITVYNDC